MPEDDVVGQVQSMMEESAGSGTTAPIESQSQEPITTPVEPQLNEKDWGFLKHLPEAERPIVEKYVKQVDANVTRRFQELHNSYAPYKELGEVEQLKNIVNLVNQMQTVEWQWQAYQTLKNQFASLEQQANGLQDEYEQPLQQQQQQPVVPPEMQIKMQQMEQVVAAMAQQRVAEQQAAKQAQEDQELDNYITQLKTEFGNFDENYVLTVASYNGGDFAAAIEQYNQMRQQFINQASQAATAPPIASGGQVAPPQTPRLGDLDGKDVRSLVTQAITHLRRSS